MNMKELVERIYQQNIPIEEKIKQLKEIELDCINQIDAQDQNMHPEQHHRLSEGLRKARDYLRVLTQSEG
ncbi:hypothetical protein [Facilibium subflavum]|uniref:hypothetical protein n=1 Tax=Facilibium subflavum TaxID=2219058 RepID=UPI000E64D372|nr:hypothetical protein [Facilibium subflavum]